jgi:hypothetical protein
VELELLEARIAGELAASARALWAETGRDPFARLPPPPALLDDGIRATLARLRALPGDDGLRATTLHRHCLAAAAFAHERIPASIARTEAAFVALAAQRRAVAARLGFANAWALFEEVHGIAAAPPDADESVDRDVDAAMADPARVLALVADALGIDAAPVTSIVVETRDAPTAGRTFVIEPGRDIRVRIWRRPSSTPRGVLRVLLHELGHALFAASWRDLPAGLAAPSSRAIDEGVAAWVASLLEREAFAATLGLPAGIAVAERESRAARRARLVAAAGAERTFYEGAVSPHGGATPWKDALAWTDPGASAAYARAEEIRDRLDAELGGAWPPRPLAPLAALGARFCVGAERGPAPSSRS